MSRLPSIVVSVALAVLAGGTAVARGASVIKASDAPVQLVVPDGWSELPRTDHSDPTVALSVVNNDADLGGAVVFEAKKHYDLTLTEYGNAVLNQMAGRSQQMTHTDWKPARVTGKYDGLRCEAHITRSGLRLAFVVTIFATADSYDQVLGWSRESAFAGARQALVALTDGFRQTGPAPATKPVVGPGVTVVSKDGSEQLDLPPGWAPSTEPLTAVTQLMATNADQAMFVQLISESREDVVLALRPYADIIVDNMLKRGTDGSHTPWRKLSVHGDDALRCEMSVTFEKIRLRYVVTVLQTPDRLQQVLAWSYASAFDQNKPALEKLADDLHPSGKKH